ncbi:MAG: hypothetical protein NUW37_09100 [Planctomycetes bacterium]|nr:hypothetical protein [Planctomycetota bacterium]
MPSTKLENKALQIEISYYAAARLWVDGIIDPLDTRKTLIHALEICDENPPQKPYIVGNPQF